MAVALQRHRGIARTADDPHGGMQARSQTTSRASVGCRAVATGGARWWHTLTVCRKWVVFLALRSPAKRPSLLAFVPTTTLDIDRFVLVITFSPVQGHACAL